MTLAEKVAADAASSNLQEVGSFSKAFRSSTLNNLEDGEVITIPEDYHIFEREINGQKAQYINVNTNTGRIVAFYPSAICRSAFVVDENGKNKLLDNGRRDIRPNKGDVVDFCAGKAIDPTMQAMKGCSLKYNILERVKTRAFGITNEAATSKDVVDNTIVAGWNFEGTKRPVGYAK